MEKRRIEILDTTLRDGEQTSGVAFAPQEKLIIARMLLCNLHVDRVELASARVSEGEFTAVSQIAQWAKGVGMLRRLEVLGFIDGGLSIQWIKSAGCEVVNLLCKGSYKHVTEQLRKTPEQHVADIIKEIERAVACGMDVNLYLEDWSNGMKQSPDYLFFMIDQLRNYPVKRFMLPDTLGILNPIDTAAYMTEMMKRYPDLHFDFHAHNDYDLAVANVFAAVSSGAKGIHTTLNGLGERAGNAPLSSVLAILHDHLKVETSICEDYLHKASKVVETYSGVHIPQNKPVIGENVFTQCAGVHADGDQKNNLYCNDLLPERFGRTREYALGKTSGKANILKNLEALGIELDDASMRKVTQRIIEFGDKKEMVTPEDLPYIISDVLKQDIQDSKIKILNYSLSLAQGLKPIASLKIEIDGEAYEQAAAGDGQYDAFMKALRLIYQRLNRELPLLVNYTVSIPPGGHTDAFVQTVISWRYKDKEFKTQGLDADQSEAAIKATLKMLHKIESL